MSSTPSKALVLIQDGLGDRPIERFGGLTPLQAAHTPAMDRIVAQGVSGTMRILNFAGAAGTDIGHLAWFGQDPGDPRFRRGPIEAAGVGVALEPDDLALRFNFATVDSQGRVLDRRAGRIRQGAGQLVESLNHLFPGDAEFYAATEHRGVLRLRGEGLSSQVTDSDPGANGPMALSVEPQSDCQAAGHTAALLNRILQAARDTLADHPVNRKRISQGLPPANAILTRSAGRRQAFTHFYQQRGLAAVVISGEATVLGLGRLAGLDALTGPSLTANLDTNLKEKARLTLDCLGRYDLTFLHLKGCDIAGHEGDADQKKRFLEKTDQFLDHLLVQAGRKTSSLLLALVADHSTPCEVGEHTADPFPVALSFQGIEEDTVVRYGESECQAGRLGEVTCPEFMEQIEAFGTQVVPLLGS